MTMLKQLKMAYKSNDCTTAHVLASQMDSSDVYHVLIFAVTDNTIDFVLAVHNFLSEQHKGNLFALAVEARNNTMVRALLPHSDPMFDDSCALQMASATQNDAIFDMLYPLSQPTKALQVMKKHSRPFEYKMLEERIAQIKISDALNKAVKKSTANLGVGRKI